MDLSITQLHDPTGRDRRTIPELLEKAPRKETVSAARTTNDLLMPSLRRPHQQRLH